MYWILTPVADPGGGGAGAGGLTHTPEPFLFVGF